MKNVYTDEANIQILIALMRHHGVRRVIASPGTTNISLVASLQGDPWFQVFSSVDERSAAYMACGMAAETGEPVALTCTGATASRNYAPGLTEAFYRKLPVLAITATQHLGRVGNMVPQVLDRFDRMNDICKLSIQLPTVHSEDDRRGCVDACNRALLALSKDGGGPVHINMVTTYSGGTVDALPPARAVDRIGVGEDLPELPAGRVAVFVGAHRPWGERLAAAVDGFCAARGAVVICDRTSNYHGPYRVNGPLVLKQESYAPACRQVDVLIHIGEISGAYADPSAREVWRVSPDGEPRNAFGALRYIFDMDEEAFFEAYAEGYDGPVGQPNALLTEWRSEEGRLRSETPELPFSNLWVAEHVAPMLPAGSVLHIGILNSLRSWNMFETDPSIECFCNTGGFGIDGCVSSLIGASLASPDKLFFGVVGDLAAFYDLNSLGNRHVGPNIRLMVVNNGVGTEFKNYNHRAAQYGEDADAFMAARGHFGNRSRDLLRHYAEDLGFEYLAASTKEELLAAAERFTVPDRLEKPILLEVFTDSRDESDALRAMVNLEVDSRHAAKNALKGVLGDKGIRAVKTILGK